MIPEAVSDHALRRHEDKLMLAWTLVTAGLIGAVTVAFMLATEHLGAYLHPDGDHAAWRRLLMPVFGSAIAGYLLRRFFPNSAGSGIPQTKAALVLEGGHITFRTAMGKFLCSTITLASGVSLGREGPSVQVGAGIASSLGRKLGLDRRRISALVPAGAAAAVSAAFNTPIAAVLFTLEELVGNLHAPLLGSVVLSAATSWLVMRSLLGDAPLFHVPEYHLVHPVEFVFYALLGIFGGVISAVFVKLILKIRLWFATFPKRTKMIQPVAGGLFVGLIAWFLPEVLGVGYPIVDEALNGKLVLETMLVLLALKVLTTAVCYSSGNAGGIFGPSLFIGAMLGGAMGSAAHSFFPDSTGSVGAYALAGMGAAFAGIIRAPLTSVIMIFEITRDYAIIVPLMISNLLAYFVSQRLQHEQVYEALLIQDNVHLPAGRPETTPRTVRDGVRPAGEDPARAAILFPDQPLEEALEVFATLPPESIASVRSRRDPETETGVITLADILGVYGRREAEPKPGQGRALLAALGIALVVLLAGVGIFSYTSRVERRTEAEAAYRRGVELASAGRPAEAIELLRTSVAVLRGEEQRLVLARTLVSAGRTAEADIFLDEVLRENPTLGPANLWKARVERATGNLSAASDRYNRALYGDWPSYSITDRRIVRWELSEVLHDLGLDDAALAELSQLVRDADGDRERILPIGQRLFVWRQFERAAQIYAPLRQQNPNDGPAAAGLARSLFGAGRYIEAASELEHASALLPERTDLREELTLAEAVRELDPAAPGLNRRSRLARAHRLVLRAAGAAAACQEKPPLAAPPPPDSVDAAREEAQRIWRARPANCPTSEADRALALLLR